MIIDLGTDLPRATRYQCYAPHSDLLAAIESGDTGVRRHRLEAALRRLFREQGHGRLVTVICVGAPSSTGDALGPLVGTMITKRLDRRARYRTARKLRLQVFGTLADPVHAMNLHERRHGVTQGEYVLAVDAAVGAPGKITLKKGPLRPGAGMGKDLPPVGDAHIMGGTASFPFGIWFANLGPVLEMAEVISEAIVKAAASVAPDTVVR